MRHSRAGSKFNALLLGGLLFAALVAPAQALLPFVNVDYVWTGKWRAIRSNGEMLEATKLVDYPSSGKWMLGAVTDGQDFLTGLGNPSGTQTAFYLTKGGTVKSYMGQPNPTFPEQITGVIDGGDFLKGVTGTAYYAEPSSVCTVGTYVGNPGCIAAERGKLLYSDQTPITNIKSASVSYVAVTFPGGACGGANATLPYVTIIKDDDSVWTNVNANQSCVANVVIGTAPISSYLKTGSEDRGWFRVLAADGSPLLARAVRKGPSSIKSFFIGTDGKLWGTASDYDFELGSSTSISGLRQIPLPVPPVPIESFALMSSTQQNIDRNSIVASGSLSIPLTFKLANGEFWFFGGDPSGHFQCNPYAADPSIGWKKLLGSLDHSEISVIRGATVYSTSYPTFVVLKKDGTLYGCGHSSTMGFIGRNDVNDGYELTRIGLLLPGTVKNISATNGSASTYIVDVKWSADNDASEYFVYRGTNPMNMVKIATVPVTDFQKTNYEYVDTPPNGGVFYYTVTANNSVGEGAFGLNASGWANYPPTSTSAELVYDIGSVNASTFPVTNDPNATDTFSYVITSQPTDGDLVYIASNKSFKFTPSNTLSNKILGGVNTFTYNATDKNGQMINGTGHIVQRCPNPDLKSSASASNIPWKIGEYSASFTAHPCADNVRLKVQVFTPDESQLISSEVFPQANSTAVNTTTAVHVDLPALDAGVYVLKASLSATILNGQLDPEQNASVSTWSETITGAYTVQNVKMPALYASKWIATQDEDLLVIEARGGSQNCPLADETTASTDFSKCFLSWTKIPPGMQLSAVSANRLEGVIKTQGGHDVEMTLSKYDPSGGKHIVGTQSGQIVVNVPIPPVFAASANYIGNVRSLMESWDFTVKQTEGSPCTLYLVEGDARTHAMGGERSCSIKFPVLPVDLTVTGTSSSAMASGRFRSQGDKTVTWEVLRWFRDGTSVSVATGTMTVTAVAPGLAFKFDTKTLSVMALVDVWKGTPVIEAGRGCTLTDSRNEALNSLTTRAPKCWATYVSKPDFLISSARYPLTVSGTFPAAGSFPIEYKVSMLFPADGIREEQEIVLKQETVNVAVVPTAPPEMVFVPVKTLSIDGQSGPISVPGYPQGSFVGRIKMTRLVAKTVDIDVMGDDGTTVIASYRKLRTGNSRYLFPPGTKAAWDTGKFTIKVWYSDYPTITTTQTVDYVTLLPNGMLAEVKSPRLALDNDLKVTVNLTVGKKAVNDTGLFLDGSKIGAWKGQLGYFKRGEMGLEWVATTPEKDLVLGKASFDLTPAMPVMQFGARAWPVSPIAGLADGSFVYAKGTKTIVNKGSPVRVSIRPKARHFALAEPFTMIWLLGALESKADMKAMAGAEWFASTDGGVTWSPDGRGTGLMLNGQIREDVAFKLKTTNRYSGLTFESDPVIIQWQPTGATSVSMAPLSAYGVNVAESTGNMLPLTLKALVSNSSLRVPVTVNVQNITGIGPAIYEWKVNGQVVPKQSGYSLLTTLTTPGPNEVVVIAVAGEATYRGAYTFNTVANKKPSCNLNETQLEKVLQVTANCNDPDGKIVAARWMLNGVRLSTSLPTVYIPLTGSGEPAQVELTVTDDSGESVSFYHNVIR